MCLLFRDGSRLGTLGSAPGQPIIVIRNNRIWNGHHIWEMGYVYLITAGLIVTSSITLSEYTRYVIITTRKPLLVLFTFLRSQMICINAKLLNSFEYETLQNRKGQWLICVEKFIGKTECKKKHRSFCSVIIISRPWKIALAKRASELWFSLARHLRHSPGRAGECLCPTLQGLM